MGYSDPYKIQQKQKVNTDKVGRHRKSKLLAKILSSNHKKTNSHSASNRRLQSSSNVDSKGNAITKYNILGEYVVY
jgi:hypothetical protein